MNELLRTHSHHERGREGEQKMQQQQQNERIDGKFQMKNVQLQLDESGREWEELVAPLDTVFAQNMPHLL